MSNGSSSNSSSSNTTSTNTTSSPILAIACGPIVTTWDISKTKLESNRNQNDSGVVVDRSASASASATTSSSNDANLFSDHGNNGTIIDLASPMSSPSLMGKLNSMGIQQFKPHGSGYDGTTVKDIVWNHNGQVLATCSNPSSPSELNGNVALTLYSTQSKVESFSNFPPQTNTNVNVNKDYLNLNSDNIQTTSISFGGSNAKSRYVCLSDDGGYISVWDLKKQPVKRVRYFRLQSRDDNDDNYKRSHGHGRGLSRSRSDRDHPRPPPCSKACIDRSDTFVVGLHGRSGLSSTDGSRNNSILYGSTSNHVTLDIFHLKNGGIITSLMDDGTHGGSSGCFNFSNFDSNRLLVGTTDGSLLLWDILSSSSKNSSGGTVPSQSPISCLGRRHTSTVTDVAFSPMNKVLAASCSMDGTIIFHDVHSEKKIQTLRPTVRNNDNSMSRLRSKGDDLNDGLTSLAFHSNGYTWAVGTDDGYVLNYDLRQISAGPLNTLNVGDGIGIAGDDIGTGKQRKSYPINRLQFAPVLLSSSSKTPKTVKKKKSPMVVGQGQERQQEQIPVSSQWSSEQQDSPVVEEGKYTTTEKEIDASPQSSTSLVKELFHQDHNKDHREESNGTSSTDREMVLPCPQENLSLEKSTNEEPQKRSPVPTSKEDSMIESSSSSNRKIRQMPDEDNTETVIKSFDQMYERLKNRETELQSPQQDSINGNSPHSKRKDDYNGSEVFMITKNEIQELVDDAVESLRDDMDDALQNMHCDFMRQLQKQSDETKLMFEMQRHEIEKLVKENAALRSENEQLRLF